MHKPHRLLALFSYLLLLIGPLLILLLRRKDRFLVYHACQSLALAGATLAVPLLWLVVGWSFAFLSVEFPLFYLIPVALLLLGPVLRRSQHASRYRDRWGWLKISLTALVALALLALCSLALNWLAPTLLPLGGPLLLMASFSTVIAAALAWAVAWLAGMANALRARERPVPVYGGWGERLFHRLSF